MTDIRVAQYGTRHAHAAGKLRAIRQNPNVELAGVFEPDAARRRALAAVDGPFQDVHWFGERERDVGGRRHCRHRVRRPDLSEPGSDGALRAGRQACLV